MQRTKKPRGPAENIRELLTPGAQAARHALPSSKADYGMANIPLLLLLTACLMPAACDAQTGSEQSPQPAPTEQTSPSPNLTQEEEIAMTSEFEGLCRITKGTHISAPTGGNRTSSHSNGTSITILGSKSQSLSSIDGKALVTVSGAAILHVEFQTGELISIETNPDHERLVITIDGPDAISCAVAI